MKTKEEVIEDLQESLVDAGGRFFRKREIMEWSVDVLLETCVPNGIEIIFRNNKHD